MAQNPAAPHTRTRSRTLKVFPAEFAPTRIQKKGAQFVADERAPRLPVATQLIISNRSACRLETHRTPIPPTRLPVLIDTNAGTPNAPATPPHPANLRPRFVHNVERRFGGAAESREAGGRHHVADALFAGLRAQARGHFLRARARRAEQRRKSVVHAA